MGMFDEFFFKKAQRCNHCKNKIDSVQTKQLECALDNFYLGDIVSKQNNFSTIIKEDIFCLNCKKSSNIYIVIKNNIYIGVNKKLEKAEKRLKKFNQKKLLKLYKYKVNKLQKEREKYNQLKNLIMEWHYYQEHIKNGKNFLLSNLFYRNVKDKNIEEFIELLKNKIKKVKF